MASPPEPALYALRAVPGSQGSGALGTATAFLVAAKSGTYLVSCKHTFTNQHLESHKWVGRPGTPDSISVWLPTDGTSHEWVKATYDLAIGNDLVYTTHHNPLVDVAVMPIAVPPETAARALTLIGISGQNPIGLTSKVCIPGFPSGLASGPFLRGEGGYPICKVGHLASPTDFPYRGLPLLLVDVMGSPGMSGAPVVAHQGESWVCYGIFSSKLTPLDSSLLDPALAEIVRITALSECLKAARSRAVRAVAPRALHRVAVG